MLRASGAHVRGPPGPPFVPPCLRAFVPPCPSLVAATCRVMHFLCRLESLSIPPKFPHPSVAARSGQAAILVPSDTATDILRGHSNPTTEQAIVKGFFVPVPDVRRGPESADVSPQRTPRDAEDPEGVTFYSPGRRVERVAVIEP